MQRQLLTTMAPRFKLTYFDIRGKAEVIRLMFAASGVEFEDKRIAVEDWSKIKPSTPFGRLPVLEFDGNVLPETKAIAGFVARATGLYGQSSLEQARIDVVMEIIHDLQLTFSIGQVQKDAKNKEELIKSFFEKDCLKFVNWLEGLLVQNQGGDGFFVGDSVSMADLDFYAGHELLLKGNPAAFQNAPKLTSLIARVEEIPKIKDWLPNRPAKFSITMP
ncbi:glutathione S-transferase-like [Asterias amurensis]|uniref:glutathione S-transferase-like n=1 Tax=Asterias amurensis TaxID=7602 RepID=UPI003AB450EA